MYRPGLNVLGYLGTRVLAQRKDRLGRGRDNYDHLIVFWGLPSALLASRITMANSKKLPPYPSLGKALPIVNQI